jgi:hypothetical protein
MIVDKQVRLWPRLSIIDPPEERKLLASELRKLVPVNNVFEKVNAGTPTEIHCKSFNELKQRVESTHRWGFWTKRWVQIILYILYFVPAAPW